MRFSDKAWQQNAALREAIHRLAAEGLVELVPRAAPLRCDAKALQRVTQAAFGQRRKMLRQSLRSLGVEPLRLLAAAGIAPTARAEEISIEGFLALARALDAGELGG